MCEIITKKYKVAANKIYTKSAYARKIKTSHTNVNALIKSKKLIAIKFNGAELVCKPKDAIAMS